MPTEELAIAMKNKKACIITAEIDSLQPSASTFVVWVWTFGMVRGHVTHIESLSHYSNGATTD